MSSSVVGRDAQAAPARTRRKVSARRLAILTGLVIAGAGGAWYGTDWWTNGRFIETTDDAYVGGNVTTISPYVAGYVNRILVGDNQPVAAGQLLVQLDRRDFQAAYDKAQAVVDSRIAALASLRAQVPLQETTIQQAQADTDAKAAHAAFTRSDGARYASLALTAAGSRQDAEKTRAADQEAQAGLAASQAALTASRQRLTVLEAQINEAQAVVEQARSDMRTAALNLGYTEIRSPIDGYVGNRSAQVGAYAPMGSSLLSIIPANGLWVDANFKEDQLVRMVPNQEATAVLDVAPGRVLKGHVLSLAPGTGAIFSVIPPENATGNFTKIVQRVPVRIALDPTDAALGTLRPGLSTFVRVNTKTEP